MAKIEEMITNAMEAARQRATQEMGQRVALPQGQNAHANIEEMIRIAKKAARQRAMQEHGQLEARPQGQDAYWEDPCTESWNFDQHGHGHGQAHYPDCQVLHLQWRQGWIQAGAGQNC
ncbi:unnamed protein product [Symbiodinium natans]|uniref:Uncharacterized protein n=1 Tax=Symbiodinium natans TaxID=878477 RepID=A0A812K6A9_9DINO|nr:unnamed protein product [Symbiodinium natans]